MQPVLAFGPKAESALTDAFGERRRAVWLDAGDCRVEELAALIAQGTHPGICPSAAEVVQQVPVYDCAALRGALDESGRRRALMAEWVGVFDQGPGVLVLRGAFADLAVVDAVTRQFEAVIEAERGQAAGDHFAPPGANDRVWNALEKLCLRAPELFAAYYGNDMLALVCDAWLGPAWQMTSQVNRVNPGGAAQTPHRDYHLGFLGPEAAAGYPAQVQRLSPFLTLQGAVAHVDMPVESGPTLYLPHSQKYLPGYLATGLQPFRDFFAAHHVQLPLQRGDAIFFNPALMHAAGHNRTHDVQRLANLLQVSSAFGRAMESVDRTRMATALYPALQDARRTGRLDAVSADIAIAAAAEGYPFPTNLDRDPPIGGLAPESPQALMRRALREGWSPDRFDEALAAMAHRRLTR